MTRHKVTLDRPIRTGFLVGLGYYLLAGAVGLLTFLVETTFWTYFE